MSFRTRFRAWLEVLRAPNLPTVPGDPLAGYLLAGGRMQDATQIGTVALAMTLIYAGALVLNDRVDRREDARERPRRPLPSGRLTAAQATAAASAALGLGGLLAARYSGVWPAAGLIAAVLAYNFLFKRIPVAGALNMGLCRALSLTAGAAAAGGSGARSVHWAAATLGLYVAAITLVARTETRTHTGSARRALPPLILAGAWIAGGAAGVAGLPRLAATGMIVLGIAARPARRLPVPTPPAATQRAVGQWIRSLVVLQAAFCLLARPPAIPAAVLLVAAALPLSILLGKYFEGS